MGIWVWALSVAEVLAVYLAGCWGLLGVYWGFTVFMGILSVKLEKPVRVGECPDGSGPSIP